MNKRSTLISPKGLIDLHKERLEKITEITTILGCKNLVPASPHIALGKTSVYALWIGVERASSLWICLVA